jgi:hypothetical protein
MLSATSLAAISHGLHVSDEAVVVLVTLVVSVDTVLVLVPVTR